MKMGGWERHRMRCLNLRQNDFVEIKVVFDYFFLVFFYHCAQRKLYCKDVLLYYCIISLLNLRHLFSF